MYKLRQDTFIVEQNCPYPDIDGKDKNSFHILGRNAKKELVAYARIVLPFANEFKLAIGRIVVDEAHRKDGIGKSLVEAAIKIARKEFPERDIHISAQKHLMKFYQKLEFKETGQEYFEDGIPHIHMTLEGIPAKK